MVDDKEVVVYKYFPRRGGVAREGELSFKARRPALMKREMGGLESPIALDHATIQHEE